MIDLFPFHMFSQPDNIMADHGHTTDKPWFTMVAIMVDHMVKPWSWCYVACQPALLYWASCKQNGEREVEGRASNTGIVSQVSTHFKRDCICPKHKINKMLHTVYSGLLVFPRQKWISLTQQRSVICTSLNLSTVKWILFYSV